MKKRLPQKRNSTRFSPFLLWTNAWMVLVLMFLSYPTLTHAMQGYIKHVPRPFNGSPELRIQLILDDQIIPELFPVRASLGVLTALESLDTEDHIRFAGHLQYSSDPTKISSVEIAEIESVGLKRLIGIWRTPSFEVFRFQDFSRLEVYRSAMDFSYKALDYLTSELKLPFRKIKDFNYSLAPDAQNQFSILMAERSTRLTNSRKRVHAGIITLINKNEAKLNVFNPETGAIVETHTLVQLESAL